MQRFTGSLILALVLFAGSPVLADEVSWPTKPIVGVIGASYVTSHPPVGSPVNGVALAGGSFEGLYKKLLRNNLLEAWDFSVETTALAGTRSYDIPGTSYIGYLTQYNELANRTSWFFDDVSRLQYLVISISNDCLHSVACGAAGQNALIENVKEVVTAANSDGVHVIINGYPSWDSLNLDLTSQYFGLTNIISADEYAQLKQLHKQELSGLDGVTYIEPWEDIETIDGLHPQDDDVRSAAKMISHAIIKNEICKKIKGN